MQKFSHCTESDSESNYYRNEIGIQVRTRVHLPQCKRAIMQPWTTSLANLNNYRQVNWNISYCNALIKRFNFNSSQLRLPSLLGLKSHRGIAQLCSTSDQPLKIHCMGVPKIANLIYVYSATIIAVGHCDEAIPDLPPECKRDTQLPLQLQVH